MNRREILIGTAAALLLTQSRVVQGAARRGFLTRKQQPLGIQIMSLGGQVGRDLDATFAAVAQIGYREVELPNLLGRSPTDIAAAAKRAGVSISSMHLPLMRNAGAPGQTLGSDPASIADTLGMLGARWAVAPLILMPNGFRPQAGESMEVALSRSIMEAGGDLWKESAARLNEVASRLKPLGVGVAYHNHNLDFAPIGDTTGWNILWGETDPDLVHFEVDIGWVAKAGLDPVRFLDTHRNRLKLLHIRDMPADTVTEFRIAMRPSEVGTGTLPWPRILRAAHRAGIRHFLVEQEVPPSTSGTDAARRAFDFLVRQ